MIMLVAGYGTFITNALGTLREDMTAIQWGIPVKVLGSFELSGWRRVVPDFLGYAVIIPDGEQSARLLVVETDERNLRRYDGVEGHPYLYDRMLVETPWGKAYVYIAGEDVSEQDLTQFKDTWQERIDQVQSPLARKLFPELFTDLSKKT